MKVAPPKRKELIDLKNETLTASRMHGTGWGEQRSDINNNFRKRNKNRRTHIRNKIKTPCNTGFSPGGMMSKIKSVCFNSGSAQVDSFLLRIENHVHPKNIYICG